ncbi:MAG: WbqC family protein [Rikenellaceae bacterium]|jgi:hypothetical protein|nr:WbqC family protein [Rikenellaceae bacterium]
MVILPTAYIGNIQYYGKLLSGEAVIELHEHYQKQSFRNRCAILSANGPITLSVPVHKTSGKKTPIRDVRIDYLRAWQHQHWMSIVSAYRNSPYFAEYEDDMIYFYEKRYEFLIDLNFDLQDKMLGLLGVNPPIAFTDRYEKEYGPEILDLRQGLSDKTRLHRADPGFTPVSYYQVFSEKMDFVPNLSILDLLCCEGPGTVDTLRAAATPN